MYRECDVQQDGTTVNRVWIQENLAVKGNNLHVNGLSGVWTVIRIYGYGTENFGIKEITGFKK